MKDFNHKALNCKENKALVYTAMSKNLFYYRMHISKFVLEQQKIPLNPFMIFEYFMLDSVDRNVIRNANNNLLMRCDELWVFGSISDGVLAEIKIAKEKNLMIKYFKIIKSQKIISISKEEVEMEIGLEEYKSEI